MYDFEITKSSWYFLRIIWRQKIMAIRQLGIPENWIIVDAKGS